MAEEETKPVEEEVENPPKGTGHPPVVEEPVVEVPVETEVPTEAPTAEVVEEVVE